MVGSNSIALVVKLPPLPTNLQNKKIHSRDLLCKIYYSFKSLISFVAVVMVMPWHWKPGTTGVNKLFTVAGKIVLMKHCPDQTNGMQFCQQWRSSIIFPFVCTCYTARRTPFNNTMIIIIIIMTLL